jgi:hypothetical protein
VIALALEEVVVGNRIGSVYQLVLEIGHSAVLLETGSNIGYDEGLSIEVQIFFSRILYILFWVKGQPKARAVVFE